MTAQGEKEKKEEESEGEDDDEKEEKNGKKESRIRQKDLESSGAFEYADQFFVVLFEHFHFIVFFILFAVLLPERHIFP